jgi:hypothetical protein
MSLTGDKLLAFLEEVPKGTPRDEIIRGAGYSFTRIVDGRPQTVLHRTAFYEAIFAAKGGELAALVEQPSSAELIVSSSGRVIIQANHMRFIRAEPGSRVLLEHMEDDASPYLTISPCR